jgi:hypothetical protein
MVAPTKPTTIYVALLDEGTDCWRPVQAEHLEGEAYRIVGVPPDPENEKWEFMPGQLVRCRPRLLSGGECLVAFARADD